MPASAEPAPSVDGATEGGSRRRATRGIVRMLEGVALTWRLVLILLVLLLSALVLTSSATAWLLHRDLVQNTDEQLKVVAEPVATSRIINIQETGDAALPSSYAFAYMPTSGTSGFVTSPAGEPLHPDLPHLALDDERVRSGQPFTVTSRDGDVKWRFIAGRVEDGSATFAVGVPLRGVNHTIHRFLVVTGIIGLSVVAASAVLGWFATRRAVRPLRKIEDVAAAIAGGDLSQRVPVRRSHDEVASLSDSLNVMLGRIEHSFAVQEASEARMRQFVADASHELRTPLATVRGYAELYRQGAIPDAAGVATSMGRIEGEAARMSILVEDLLTLARLDDERPLDVREVDLVVLSAEVAHDARARDPQRPISVHGLDGELSPVIVAGDDARLRQVLSNLVANALMHTADGVAVEVCVGHLAGEAVVEVRDHGAGLDPGTADKVFQRFFRADKARSRARGGSGLGLAIVSAIVAQHHGRVSVHDTPGGGATFRVALPTGESQPGPSVD